MPNTDLPISDLSLAVIDTIPANIDWQEAMGEDMEGWRFWDADEREFTSRDGATYQLTLITTNGSEPAFVFTEAGERIDLDDPSEYWEIERPCRHCSLPVVSYDGNTWVGLTEDGESDECTGDTASESEGAHEVEGVLTTDDMHDLRQETLYREGPMMNYWYSLQENDTDSIGPYGHSFDAVEAAYRLSGSPLCLVEVDGVLGLALTGGGMDFTWEIVEAFMALGYLPPVHFCSLPGMAGRGPGRSLPDGWSITADREAPQETCIVVTNSDGQEVARYGDYYTAEANHMLPRPASERDQRIIDGVTAALIAWRDRMQYRLERHLTDYGPKPQAHMVLGGALICDLHDRRAMLKGGVLHHLTDNSICTED